MLAMMLGLALAGPSNGTYEAVLTQSEADGEIGEAIEKGVAQFSYPIRWVARSRLQEVRDFCEIYIIEREGASWKHTCDAKPATVGQIGTGPEPFTRDDGTTIQRTISDDSGNVTVKWAGDEGGRQQTFRWQDDRSFVLDVEIISERLDPNITWSLRYVKKE